MTHANYKCVPPPIESLLAGDSSSTYWPRRLLNETSFQLQLQTQKNLLRHLQDTYAVLPAQMTLAKGLNAGVITGNQVEQLCNALANQLEHDAAQQRLVLYIPLELLSPITVGSSDVIDAALYLKQTYRVAWEQQLTQHEVRANYVDGDVLEPELRTGDHQRVVKAAHLIPGLLQVGHLTVPKVLEYQSRASDPVLKRSIGEAVTVATELGLFPREQIISYPHEDSALTAPTTLTEGRARWLASVEVAKQRAAEAVRIASGLGQGSHVSQFTESTPDIAVGLEAIRLAALQDKAVLSRHKDWIAAVVAASSTAEVHDSLVKLGAHLFARGLVDKDVLKSWDIVIPDLGGSFFANRYRLKPTRDVILETCARISLHPRLGQMVYPVALIFGSQIKGYGLTEADCDIAVFVRPGVDRSEQSYLEQELATIYSDEHFGGKVMLFWLKENQGQLRVLDWSEPTYSDGESSWLHVLFGALWFGESDTIRLLHERLLVPYFSAPNRLLVGKPIYERWLEEMGRDSLQYRLLHKGFERFYPIESPVNTPNGRLIDGQAAFYDSRYRRIATELFVRRVWLPQL